MVKYSDEQLDSVFAALADPTRRGILESLSHDAGLAVTELAAPHEMSLPGFMKQASVWMGRYEKFWTEKLDSLARYLYQQEELQQWKPHNFRNNKPKSRKSPFSHSSGAIPSRCR